MTDTALPKCRTCHEDIELSWLFCEICGKKTNNKINVDEECIINNQILLKKNKGCNLERRLRHQSSKIERTPACVTKINREADVDPEASLEKARAAAREEELNILKLHSSLSLPTLSRRKVPEAKHPHKHKQSPRLASILNSSDFHTEQMTSFLQAFNQSTMTMSTHKSACTSPHSFHISSKVKNNSLKNRIVSSRRKTKACNQTSPDFFKSDLDRSKSQNFNVSSSQDSRTYLGDVPSLLQIFDDPSLLQVETVTEKGGVADTEAKRKVGEGGVDVDPTNDGWEDVLYWGNLSAESEGRGNDDEEGERGHSSGLERTVGEMKLFRGDFWGADHDQVTEDIDQREGGEGDTKKADDENDVKGENEGGESDSEGEEVVDDTLTLEVK